MMGEIESMSLRSPDAGSFENLLEEVNIAARTLLRLSKYPKTEPFWSRGRYRFDGPSIAADADFGTCYAAEDIEVAFSESVIHECAWFRDGQYEIVRKDLTGRHVVHLQRPARPELVLADFTGKALKRLGLNNDISAGDDYTMPMAWAKAVHNCNPKWDGIRYISRQSNKGSSVALFERSGVTRASTRKLPSRVLDQLCDEFHVVAI